MKNSDRLKVKRRLPLTSLQAVICNVALFKSMKEREFRDSIFISYNNTGVILEAVTEKEWQRACDHILQFIKNKRIELLTHGFEKEHYESFINKGLKEYTKKLKDSEEECPYINLIHYQRLRKSCEFMDRENYTEPLKQWESKNQQTPYFAYLVVEPAGRFDQVKKDILQMLKGEGAQVRHLICKIKQLVVLFMNWELTGDTIRSLYEKREMDVRVVTAGQRISLTLYSDTNITMPEVVVTRFNSRLSRLGYRVLRQQTLRRLISILKDQVKEASQAIERMQQKYLKKFGQSYCFVIVSRENRQADKMRIGQLQQLPKDLQVIRDSIQRHVVCEWHELKHLNELPSPSSYRTFQSIINGCYMLTQHYTLYERQLESFSRHLDHLGMYYNASLMRFYGIAIRPPNQYMLLFDYKSKTLQNIHDKGQFVDELQVATVILNLLHCINFLHTHSEPKCLGRVSLSEIYYPITVILPYLPDDEDTSENEQHTFQNDVYQTGKIFRFLLSDPNQQLMQLVQEMTDENPSRRIKLEQAITRLEEAINNG